MAPNIKDNGGVIKLQVGENSLMPMEIFMMDNG